MTFGSLILSMSIGSERVSGNWNRALSVGVKPKHFLLSHLLEGLFIVLLQTFEWFLYLVVFLLPNQSWNTMVLTFVLLLLCGIYGATYGLLCSIAINSVMGSFVIAQFSIFPAAYISGEKFQQFFIFY